jgi:hypothetical protein
MPNNLKVFGSKKTIVPKQDSQNRPTSEGGEPSSSHERGKDREVPTTSGTYPWSFVTPIFYNGQPSHGGDRKTFELMTSI